MRQPPIFSIASISRLDFFDRSSIDIEALGKIKFNGLAQDVGFGF
jgi:hypothetical protein